MTGSRPSPGDAQARTGLAGTRTALSAAGLAALLLRAGIVDGRVVDIVAAAFAVVVAIAVLIVQGVTRVRVASAGAFVVAVAVTGQAFSLW